MGDGSIIVGEAGAAEIADAAGTHDLFSVKRLMGARPRPTCRAS